MSEESRENYQEWAVSESPAAADESLRGIGLDAAEADALARLAGRRSAAGGQTVTSADLVREAVRELLRTASE